MKLSIGIVGLPNVGKSTLFQNLTELKVNVANYPFATIDPNVGVVGVPDQRLERLVLVSRSAKVVPATIEFYDIAGLVKGSYQGEGLGNQFLSHIREVDAIVQMVRCFSDKAVVHIEGDVSPKRDIEIIHTELIFKDMETLKRRLEKLQKESRSGDKKAIEEMSILEELMTGLEKGIMVQRLLPRIKQTEFVKRLSLLTAKPQILFLNGVEAEINQETKEYLKTSGFIYLIKNLKENPALDDLIQAAYQMLGLISFFTINEKETRVWAIKEGTTALEAAGAIHGDFEKKFIRAEVINWQKLIEAGSWSAARSKGLVGLEGKDYIVKDGDVLLIRHGA